MKSNKVKIAQFVGLLGMLLGFSYSAHCANTMHRANTMHLMFGHQDTHTNQVFKNYFGINSDMYAFPQQSLERLTRLRDTSLQFNHAIDTAYLQSADITFHLNIIGTVNKDVHDFNTEEPIKTVSTPWNMLMFKKNDRPKTRLDAEKVTVGLLGCTRLDAEEVTVGLLGCNGIIPGMKNSIAINSTSIEFATHRCLESDSYSYYLSFKFKNSEFLPKPNRKIITFFPLINYAKRTSLEMTLLIDESSSEAPYLQEALLLNSDKLLHKPLPMAHILLLVAGGKPITDVDLYFIRDQNRRTTTENLLNNAVRSITHTNIEDQKALAHFVIDMLYVNSMLDPHYAHNYDAILNPENIIKKAAKLLRKLEGAGQAAATPQEGDLCSICRNDEELLSDDPVTTTYRSCGHGFHEPCITEWNAISLACPLCRDTNRNTVTLGRLNQLRNLIDAQNLEGIIDAEIVKEFDQGDMLHFVKQFFRLAADTVFADLLELARHQPQERNIPTQQPVIAPIAAAQPAAVQPRRQGPPVAPRTRRSVQQPAAAQPAAARPTVTPRPQQPAAPQQIAQRRQAIAPAQQQETELQAAFRRRQERQQAQAPQTIPAPVAAAVQPLRQAPRPAAAPRPQQPAAPVAAAQPAIVRPTVTTRPQQPAAAPIARSQTAQNTRRVAQQPIPAPVVAIQPVQPIVQPAATAPLTGPEILAAARNRLRRTTTPTNG